MALRSEFLTAVPCCKAVAGRFIHSQLNVYFCPRMKAKYALLLFLLLGLGACEKDFDITADYKETPVIYALLNAQENTHYVRIQKGYLIDGNAYAGAANADSIYYSDSLFVQVKTLPNGPVYTLQKVDGNLIGLPKDPGSFANQPNILYRFTGNLDASKSYQLVVKNTANNKEFGATTTLVNDFTVITPYKGQKLSLLTSNPPKLTFYTAQNAGVYDMKVRFPYKEYDAVSNALLKDTFEDVYIFRSELIDFGGVPSQQLVEFNAVYIMNSLQRHLTKTTSVYRTFNPQAGMTFFYAAGGEELAKFTNSQLAQANSLASNEALPPYTNVQDGYGIFSSRYFKQVDSVVLTTDALDSLACSPLMSGLRFKGGHNQICD